MFIGKIDVWWLVVNHISGSRFSVARKLFGEYIPSGELAERSIAAVLKTVVLQGTGGSNPSLSDFYWWYLMFHPSLRSGWATN